MDHRVLVLTFPNKNAREYFVSMPEAHSWTRRP